MMNIYIYIYIYGHLTENPSEKGCVIGDYVEKP
jgi:hypothetical protein